MTLSKDGFLFRQRLAEAGIEVTPDQLEASVDEADERIRPCPDGTCSKCHRREREDGSRLDFRFGMCQDCGVLGRPFAIKEEGDAAFLVQFQERQREAKRKEIEQVVAVDRCRRLAREVGRQEGDEL